MPSPFHLTFQLHHRDFSLFHQRFSDELSGLFPAGGEIHFWDGGGRWLSPEKVTELVGHRQEELKESVRTMAARVTGRCLVLPVPVAENEGVVVLAGPYDSGLLEKISEEWLQEACEVAARKLIAVKNLFLHPETGLFTSRILDFQLSGTGGASGIMFLVGAPERGRRPSRLLLNVTRTARLLEQTLNRHIIYFGSTVYGFFMEQTSRERGLDLARKLLGRLKREGLQRVHIGLAVTGGEGAKVSPEQVMSECWQALEVAEQRGPFSLCEASFLHNRHRHPLAKPLPPVSRKLQARWRGLDSFSLLLLRSEPVGKKKRGDLSFAALTAEFFENRGSVVPMTDGQCYVLLSNCPSGKAEQEAVKGKNYLESHLGVPVAVGIASWPCQDYPRTSAMVNCRKALMHGDFFGQGSVTLFDHVSLNVSGDYFFDEGDYRQAVREYRAGLAMKPGEPNLLNSLGVTLTELKQLREAVSCFDHVLKRDSRNFMALVNKGFALRMLNREQEAVNCLVRAAKCSEFTTSSVSNDVSLLLGRLQSSRGKYKEALRVLEPLQTGNGRKTGGYLLANLLGEAYAETGKNEQAIHCLQDAVRLNPHDADSLSFLGYLYCRENQGDDIALSFCRQAVELDDRTWKNWYRLAEVLFRVPDLAGAQEAVRESLRRKGAGVEALFLAGNIALQMGRRKQSERMFRKVLQLAPAHKGAKEALREGNKKN